MRIVHLYANWKWTGPAEPAVNLAASLARLGHEVTFLPGRSIRGLDNQIAAHARERGLSVEEGLTLDKHFRPIANLTARRRLARILRGLEPDLLHCHTPNDHLVGGAVAKKLRDDLPNHRSHAPSRTNATGPTLHPKDIVRNPDRGVFSQRELTREPLTVRQVSRRESRDFCRQRRRCFANDLHATLAARSLSSTR